MGGCCSSSKDGKVVEASAEETTSLGSWASGLLGGGASKEKPAPVEVDLNFRLKDRHGCTDVPCCVVFLLGIALFTLFFQWSLADGNLGRLTHGINYKGEVCGVNETVLDKPYLYWCPSAQGGMSLKSTKPICVSACPGADAAQQLIAAEPGCSDVTSGGAASLETMVGYKTRRVLNRYCMPDAAVSHAEQKAANALSDGQLQGWDTKAMEALSSIPAGKFVLLGAFFFAILLSFTYLMLLRQCAKLLVWVVMLSTIALFGLSGLYLWMNAETLSGQAAEAEGANPDSPTLVTQHGKKATQGLAIACWTIAGVALLITCCLQKSIRAATACVEVACDVLFKMPVLLVSPIVKAAIKGALSAVLMYGFLMLYSTAPMSHGGDGLSRHFKHSETFNNRLLFYMLIAFWIIAFVGALCQFVVAYVVAEYYYTPYDSNQKKAIRRFSILDGLFVGLFYHSGSLAFGSFLIAVLQVLQKVIEYAEYKNKEGGGNPVVSCVLRALLCCVMCIKEIVAAINNLAYIDMAITSNSFCSAAKGALAMILKQGGAMLVLNGATLVFTIFGCLFVCLGSAGGAYFVASSGDFADPSSESVVESPETIAVVAGIMGLSVAHVFMNVFDVTSDTLLYCYGLDQEENNGGNTAPPELKGLFKSGGFENDK